MVAFLFPLGVLWIDEWGNALLVLASMVGLIGIILPGDRGIHGNDQGIGAALGIGVAAYLGIALLSFLMTGFSDAGWKLLGRYARLAGAWLIFISVRRLSVPSVYFGAGLCVGSIIAGAGALWQSYHPHDLIGRVHGITHPILFGDVCLVLAFMGAAWVLSLKNLKQWRGLCSGLVLTGGMLASALSGSRGSWLALSALGGLWLWQLVRCETKTNLLPAALIITAIGLGLLVWPQSSVRDRFSTTWQEWSSFRFNKEPEGSMATRFYLWRSASLMWRESPVVGVGMGQYPHALHDQVDQGRAPEILLQWDHPHSEYFSVLATRGFLGLGSVLALLMLPAWKQWRLCIRDGPDNWAAMAGVMLIVGYAFFCLTETMFDRGFAVTAFAFLLGMSAALATPGEGA